MTGTRHAYLFGMHIRMSRYILKSAEASGEERSIKHNGAEQGENF